MKIAIIQTIEIDIILITDHETTLTRHQITAIAKIDPVLNPGIDKTVTQIDIETTLSQHIDLTLNIQNHN